MEIKLAQNDYPVHEIIRKRWSPRSFDNRFIDPAKLRSMFEAARWSPSASNLQPWYFIIGMKGDETYAKIMDTLVEFNQLWAPTAPVLFVAVAAENTIKGTTNHSAVYDLGQSVAYLTIQAMHEGLYVHQMAGFDVAKATFLMDIPAGYKPVTVSAVGYPGKPDVLHPNLKPMEIAPRERRKAAGSVFSGIFGQPSNIF